MLSIHLPQATPRMAAALQKPLMLTETTIEDVSAKWAALLILGPHTAKILETRLGVAVPSPFACARAEWQGQAVLALSYQRFGVDGAILVTDHKERLETALDLESLDDETLETLRVEAGLPALGVDTDDDSLPLELPLEPAINFDKGCYLGQETTARMKNFGHANRAFVALKLERPSDPGASVLFDDRPVGRLTSLAHSPQAQGFLGLATIRKEHSAPGTRLRIEGAASAEVIAVKS